MKEAPEVTLQEKTQQSVKLLLASAEHVAAMLAVSVRLIRQMDASGRLGPMPILLGRRKLWSVAELAQWVRAGCPPRQQWQTIKKEFFDF